MVKGGLGGPTRPLTSGLQRPRAVRTGSAYFSTLDNPQDQSQRLQRRLPPTVSSYLFRRGESSCRIVNRRYFWVVVSTLEEESLDQEASIRHFLDLAEDWKCGFNKTIQTLLAFKRGGRWQLEDSMVIWFTDFFDETENLNIPEIVETASLLAIREVREFDMTLFEQHLKSLDSDPYYTSHPDYEIEIPDDAKSRPSFYLEPFTPQAFPGNWRWPALNVSSGSGLTQHHLPNRQRLDLELFAHHLPYAGLDDLLDAFGISRDVMQRGHSNPKTTWIITHPAIILRESNISDGQATIQIRCPANIDGDDLSLGMRVFTGTPPILRENIQNSEIDWQSAEKWKTGTICLPMATTAVADVHLSYKGQYLGHYWIADPNRSLNPKADIHRLFDTKNIVGSGFFDVKANLLEDSVAILLDLLGLTTIKYGGIPQLQDAPDILAFSNSGHLFVIECTTTDVGRSGKLLKLRQRTREITEAVTQGALGYRHIQPVMFTVLEKEETKSCWEEAAEFGISLVCRENIEEMIKRVATPPTPQEIYEAAVAAIPPKNNKQEFPFPS